ncbi:NACHT domain-containing protein [Rhodococcus opacus]|uniref:NACHT domain-containing protein n=1 Tax=Rhodococcus opacus TaxID=37919 RepID=A0A076EZY3_RHOOP|nr:hypothetical protein [Rhodococcus opacus]AII10787.1 hypothetical protein EP51_42110 [Rhodococcus opacus]
MTYDLTRLGSNRFEHLVQALTIGHLGHGVDIFGVGPDGGREATFHGEVDMEGKGIWNGYGVIQAKYKERLTTTKADQAWFFEQATAELNAWVDPKKARYKNQPDYLILVTNVPLTSVADSGGLDRLERLIAHYRDLKDERTGRKIGMPDFKDYAVWHPEYLDRLLENNGEVRRSYADLVLPGDVISRLYEQVTESDERLAHAWIGHVTRALTSDAMVELGESGDRTNSPMSLAEIAVDLPSSFESRHATPSPALRLLVDRGDQVLSPVLTPAARDRIVVLGGPGSGKSTLSRLLCQLYRVALVQEAASGRVTPQIAERARQIREALNSAGLPSPTLHRLPVRVVLSTFADEVSRSSDLTLLQHILEVINRRGSDPISVPEAKRLLTAWPLLLVLDGMDEVASADNRQEVSTRIADFLSEMAALRADVFTVCTSRPVGFEHDSDIEYQELILTPLTPSDAMNYASRLLAHKFADNPDRQDQTLERLEVASRGTETARLMTSPLQVTILSLLLEQRRQAPASRYALFNNYYDVIYARECNKPSGIGDVLETYRSQFDQLHQRCGLAIHVRAERAGEAESILPREDLADVAREILESEGHRHSDRDALIEQILQLAQQRLVLLVPRMDGVAFEVRSLAEFFAARCLMESEDAAENLQLLVPSAHWRHTWLLAAGYIFAERRSLRDTVLSRLTAADHNNSVNRLVMPGAILAVDALKDGFAANTPRFEEELVVIALRLVTGPIGSHITRLADALIPFMERSPELNGTVWRELDALLADRSPGATRTFLVSLEAASSDTIATRAANTLEKYSDQFVTMPAVEGPENTSTTDAIRSMLVEAGIVDAEQADRNFLDVLPRKSFDGNGSERSLLEAREIIVEGCRDDYRHRSKIRTSLAEAIEHDSVGHLLG